MDDGINRSRAARGPLLRQGSTATKYGRFISLQYPDPTPTTYSRRWWLKVAAGRKYRTCSRRYNGMKQTNRVSYLIAVAPYTYTKLANERPLCMARQRTVEGHKEKATTNYTACSPLEHVSHNGGLLENMPSFAEARAPIDTRPVHGPKYTQRASRNEENRQRHAVLTDRGLPLPPWQNGLRKTG